MSSDGKVSIELTAETAQFVSSVKQASEQFKQAFDVMGKGAVQAGRSIDQAFASLNIRPLAQIKKEAADAQTAFGAIAASAGRSSAEAQRAYTALQAKLRELAQEAKGAGTALDSATSPLAGIGGRLGAAVASLVSIRAAFAGIREVVQAGLGFEKIESTLKVATGSTEGARREFDFIKKVANELGLELTSTAQSYAKFTAATKGTTLEGAKARDVFVSVSKAATAMKLSGAETEGIFLALTQMMAKGKVQAEEFRGQLGERLPLAMTAATKATGLTTAEFSKMLDEGKVLSDDFLPKFAAALEQLVGSAALEGAQGLQAQLNRLSNAWQEFLLVIAQSGVVQEMTAQLKDWIAELNKMKQTGELQAKAKQFADAIVFMGKAAAGAVEFLARFHKELLALGGIVAAAKVAKFALEVHEMAKALGYATIASRALSVAMRAIPLLAIAAGAVKLYEIADGFIELQKQAERAADPVAVLKRQLTGIGEVKVGDIFTDTSAAFRASIAEIERSYGQMIASLIAGDKASADAFRQATSARLAQLAQVRTASEKAEQDVAARQKELDRKKEADAQAAAKRSVEDAKRTAKEKAEAANIADKAARKSAEDRIKAEEAANKQAALSHKSFANAVERQEQELKERTEQIKQQRLAAERQIVAVATAAAAERLRQIASTEEQIAQLVRQRAEARANAERQAGQAAIDISKKVTAQLIFDASGATGAAVEAERQRNASILLERESWRGKVKALLANEKADEKAHADTLAAIAQQGADKMISIKEQQRAELEQRLGQIQSAYQKALGNIKTLEQELAGTMKGFADVEFDIKLGGMGDAEKFVALQQKGVQIVEEMRAIRAQAASENRALTDDEIKQMKALGTEAQSTARSIAGLGQTGPDAAIQKTNAISEAMKLLGAASDQAGGSIRDAISAEKANADGLKGQINDTQGAIKSLSDEIAKLREIKIEIKANEGDAAKLEGILKRLQDMALKEFVASLQIDTSKAEAAIAQNKAKAEQPTQSTHTVLPNTTQADAAINRLQQPTSSIHTVYVRQVETRAGGGPVFRRMSGAIRGPGTGTSDSIPALISNGEFVVRAAAVRALGLDVLHAINAGYIPTMPAPRYATGGLVGELAAAGNGQRDVVDVRFDIGGKRHTVQSSRDTARGLASALRELSRG